MALLALRKLVSQFIFASRWMLYVINIGLLCILALYIAQFLYANYFVIKEFKWNTDLEPLMVVLLGFVDASMVASLVIMIVQGGHQIFIQKFKETDLPQYLDHIDTGILKVKVAMSITSITLVKILKDFVDLEKSDWALAEKRLIIHGIVLGSALVMAMIWRIMHPQAKKEKTNAAH